MRRRGGGEAAARRRKRQRKRRRGGIRNPRQCAAEDMADLPVPQHLRRRNVREQPPPPSPQDASAEIRLWPWTSGDLSGRASEDRRARSPTAVHPPRSASKRRPYGCPEALKMFAAVFVGCDGRRRRRALGNDPRSVPRRDPAVGSMPTRRHPSPSEATTRSDDDGRRIRGAPSSSERAGAMARLRPPSEPPRRSYIAPTPPGSRAPAE
jgi:hypothetical protein